MGETGRVDVEHCTYRAGASGKFPSWYWMGAVYGCRHPCSQCTGSSDRIFTLGASAQMKKSMLNNPKHLILEAPHPSPLSAYRGFFGCKHFSQTNAFLEKNELSDRWQIEDV